MSKIITVVGARPQFIKAAPLTVAFSDHGGFNHDLLHTGQHYDAEMSDVFFEDLRIPPPKWNLGIGGGSHGAMTGRMLAAIEQVLIDERPAMVIVFGDTNSTMAGALAAVKLAIPVAHIEAGLRSFLEYQPEEINRVLTDRVSSLLLCPTEAAVSHLANEGMTRGVHHVGDVMFDAALGARAVRTTIATDLDLAREPYCLVTMHRAENVDEPKPLERLLAYVCNEAAGRRLLFPIHPRTRARVETFGADLRGFEVINPLGYFEAASVLANASVLFTDSGGMQKEAYFHRVPCVTLRETSEWVETIDNGWNRLWTAPDWKPRREITSYGDGRSAEKIVTLIAQYFDERRP